MFQESYSFELLSSSTGFYLWEAYVIWVENIYPPEKIFAFVSYTFHGGIRVWEFPKDHGYKPLREPSQTPDSWGYMRVSLSVSWLFFHQWREIFLLQSAFWEYSHWGSRTQDLHHVDTKWQVLRLCRLKPSPSPPKESQASAFGTYGPGF